MSTATPGVAFLPPFKYKDLGSRGAIRTVILHQGSQNDPIQCSVQHDRIRNRSYEALSYEWGLPSEEDPLISIDGCQFRIRQNLFQALHHLRDSAKDRHIWIDAICINQADIIEKGQQIQMMGEVYRHASQVVVWLGVHDEESRVAMNAFERIIKDPIFESYITSNQFRPQHQPPPASLSHNPAASLSYTPSVDKNAPRGVFISEEEINAISSWATRSYWTRVWVVQEAILAQQLVMRCGHSHISRSDLRDIFSLLYCSELKIVALTSGITEKLQEFWAMRISSVVCLLIDGLRWSDLPLHIWIQRCTSSECTEPRDHVFGLLGIGKDTHQFSDTAEFRPVLDYSMNMVELYQATLRIKWVYQHDNGVIISKDHSQLMNFQFEANLRLKLGLRVEDTKTVNDEIEALYENVTCWVVGPKEPNEDEMRRLGAREVWLRRRQEWTTERKRIRLERVPESAYWV
jgi:hypothetical protein